MFNYAFIPCQLNPELAELTAAHENINQVTCRSYPRYNVTKGAGDVEALLTSVVIHAQYEDYEGACKQLIQAVAQVNVWLDKLDQHSHLLDCRVSDVIVIARVNVIVALQTLRSAKKSLDLLWEEAFSNPGINVSRQAYATVLTDYKQERETPFGS